jgi:hypothetical protein
MSSLEMWEIVKQLAATCADTTLATRDLEIRKERLARALGHQWFITVQIRSSNRSSHRTGRDSAGDPLRFRCDRT